VLPGNTLSFAAKEMKNPNGTNHVVHKKNPMAYSVEYLSSRKYRIQYT
jgi:hypothetical protein|tara:strand:- start:36 stop:179 length:144 start_codon:yes stop_codon:yes gene_type:complete